MRRKFFQTNIQELPITVEGEAHQFDANKTFGTDGAQKYLRRFDGRLTYDNLLRLQTAPHFDVRRERRALPQSEIEIGIGAGGCELLRTIEHHVEAHESFEIVHRRLLFEEAEAQLSSS